MDGMLLPQYRAAIDDIVSLDWRGLSAEDLTAAAWAYYFFSIQFRENLEAALALYPDDANLRHLTAEECDTANLSPWPGIAAEGERMNHDEFMRRALELSPLAPDLRAAVERHGAEYLERVRAHDRLTKALSIASYEDGGLEATFRAMLTAPQWDTPLLTAFQHFLLEHIRFDSDPDAGHGALSRHLSPDDRVLPLWQAFRDLLVRAAPALAR